jgi:hypothetical protein
MDSAKLLLLLAPVFLIEVGLMIFCWVRLAKMNKTKYLNKPIWAILVLIFYLIAPVLFLILEGGHDDCD